MPVTAAPERPAISGTSAGPARRVVAVSPSDSDELADECRSLYITGAGNVCFIAVDDTASVTMAVPANFVLPVKVRKVLSTGTTATGIFALYGG